MRPNSHWTYSSSPLPCSISTHFYVFGCKGSRGCTALGLDTMPTCLPLRVCCFTRHFSTDISSLNVMKPKPLDMPSGFLSTCMDTDCQQTPHQVPKRIP